MRDVCAFVVGVARYGTGWKSDSAAQNAYAVARFLLLGKVSPERIYAFIDAEGLSESQRQALTRRGIRLRPTMAEEIGTFWRSELPDLLSAGDKLFAYWSGHGATDTKQNRIFFCRDYTDRLISKVFNANEFLAYLRSGGYAQSEEQVFFADVCGTYNGNSLAPTDSRPDVTTMREIDQLIVYASPDGAYATAKDYGAFTSLLFGVLAGFRANWPTSDVFLARLTPAIEQPSQRPFWIQWRGKHQEQGERLVGRSNGYVKAITKLLGPYSLAGDTLKQPYIKTIRNRHVEPMLSSYELARLIDALISIKDEWESGAPLALVQFLTRLSREATLEQGCKEAIEGWIEQNTTRQVQAEIDLALAGQRARVMLLVDIASDRKGNPAEAEAQLLEADGWPVAGFPAVLHTVTSEDELLVWIVKQVELTLELDETARPEVHVFVDPPLFHVPFHKTTLDLFALGKQFDCILHFRGRALGHSRTQPERWEAWAASLKGTAPNRLALLKIELNPAPLPAGKGICFTSFAHGPAVREQAQVLRLTELLLRGAPYLCWPVDEVALVGADIGSVLRTMVDGAAEFDAIPERIRSERLNGCVVANELAILWDDPDRKLLPLAIGVAR